MAASEYSRGRRMTLVTGCSQHSPDAAGARAKEVDEEAVENAVGTSIVVDSITRDIQKRRLCDYVPYYAVFVVTFGVQVGLDRLYHQRTMFHSNTGNLRMLKASPDEYLSTEEPPASMFHKVGSYDDLWAWLEEATLNAWPQGMRDGGDTWTVSNSSVPNAYNIPLGFLVLRQFRVNADACGSGLRGVLPEKIVRALGTSIEKCNPEFNTDTASVQDYPESVPTRCGGPFCGCYPQHCSTCCAHVDSKLGTSTCSSSPTAAPTSSPVGAGSDPQPACGTWVRPPWTSNLRMNASVRPPDSIPRRGAAFTYLHPSQSFTQLIPLDQPVRDGLLSLCYLKELGWVDNATRAVLLEVVSHNQVSYAFVFTSLLVERLASNSYVPSLKSFPFHVLSLSASSDKEQVWAILVLDVLLFVLFTGDLSRMICVAKWDVTLVDKYIFWRMWGLVHFCVFFFAWWLRLQLWLMAWGMGEGWFEDNDWRIRPDGAGFADGSPEHQCAQTRFMWEQLSEYAEMHDMVSTMLAICVVVVVIRLLEFGTVGRVNILTETLALAGGDFLSVLLLGAVVVVGFGMSAHILFGDSIENYSHLWISFGSLLQIMASGDSPDFDAMQQHHRWEARFLVFLFYTLAWLILLNMILAIIISSFETVQDSDPGDADGAYDAVKAAVSQWWGGSRKMCVPSRKHADASSSDETDEESEPGGWIQTRTEVVRELAAERVAADGMDEEEFCERYGSGHRKKEQLEGIFKSAARAARARNNRVKRGDRWAVSLSRELTEAQSLQSSMEELFKAGESLRGDVCKLEAVNRGLQALVGASGVHGDLKEIKDTTEMVRMKLSSPGGGMQSDQQGGPFLQQVRTATDSIERCLGATRAVLSSKTEELEREVRTGTLWGAPLYERRAFDLPRLQTEMQPESPRDTAVKSVRVYGYGGAP